MVLCNDKAGLLVAVSMCHQPDVYTFLQLWGADEQTTLIIRTSLTQVNRLLEIKVPGNIGKKWAYAEASLED